MTAPAFFGFAPKEFELFTEEKWGSTTYNDARLAVRRKLAALVRPIEARFRQDGVPLEAKTTLHHPARYNAERVRMIKAYFARDRAARRPLKELLGADLGADADPHYQQTQLWAKLDAEGVEFSLSIHPLAWWDAETLRRACASRDGRAAFCQLLRPLDRHALRLHDWGKLYPCREIYPDEIEELMRNYRPAEHWLFCFRRLPPDEVVALGAGFQAVAEEEIARLLPVYAFVAWTPERNLILGGGRP